MDVGCQSRHRSPGFLRGFPLTDALAAVSCLIHEMLKPCSGACVQWTQYRALGREAGNAAGLMSSLTIGWLAPTDNRQLYEIRIGRGVDCVIGLML